MSQAGRRCIYVSEVGKSLTFQSAEKYIHRLQFLKEGFDRGIFLNVDAIVAHGWMII